MTAVGSLQSPRSLRGSEQAAPGHRSVFSTAPFDRAEARQRQCFGEHCRSSSHRHRRWLASRRTRAGGGPPERALRPADHCHRFRRRRNRAGVRPLDQRRRSGQRIRDAVQLGHLVIKGGGHAMAAGLTIERSKLGALRAFLEEHFAKPPAAMVGACTWHRWRHERSLARRMAHRDLLERAGPFMAQPGTGFVVSGPPHRLCRSCRAGDVMCAATFGRRRCTPAGNCLSLPGHPIGRMLLERETNPCMLPAGLNINDWGGKRTRRSF